jgi:hypothetical protein
MKASILFCLMISMIIIGCAQQKSTSLEGAWSVVSWHSIRGGLSIEPFPEISSGGGIKIWSKNHVLFVGRYKTDTVYLNDYGGGTFKLNGNRYEENLLYFCVQKEVGTTVRILLEIKNDTLIQTWPADKNWQVDKANYDIQKMIRID